MNMRAILCLLVSIVGGCTHLQVSSVDSVEEALSIGSVLSMKDVKLNQFQAVPKGYAAKYLVTKFGGEKYIVEDRFIGEFDGGYLFETYADDEKISIEPSLLKDGRIYYKSKERGYISKDRDNNCDIFFIGECNTRWNKIKTRSYDGGVWMLQYRGLGLTRISISTIYDKYGLILYRENINTNIASPSRNGKTTMARVK